MASPAQPPSGAPAAGAAQPRTTFTFVIPPPVTVWLQFDDGSRVGLAPTPQRLASSIMGRPLFGGLPIMMPAGLSGLFGGGGSLDQQLHELFMRTQSGQHGPPPTSKAFLEKIPLKTWNVNLKETEKHTDCSICLCDYEDNDEVLPLPCGHQFHKECGMKWLVEHNVCPTCRYALPTQEGNISKPESVTTAEPAAPAATPVSEPDAEEEPVRNSRVRQRSLHDGRERLVRRRLSERDALVIPSSVDFNDDDALDSILDAEATQFVAEEEEKRRAADITFDDADVEKLFHENAN